jgi:hypothetical protein
LLGVAFGGILVAGVLWQYGTSGVMMLVVVATALVPLVSGTAGQVPSIAGVDTTTLRTVVLSITVLGVLLVVDGSKLSGIAPAARRVLIGLVALGALGFIEAAATTTPATSTLRSLAQAGGQPLLYAALFAAFLIMLRTDPQARERLGTAWCLSLVIEGVVSLNQYRTGGAYDALRGYTRVSGSMGADFLGLFAASGLFGALWVRSMSESVRLRRLALAAAAASVAMVAAALARGAVVGVCAGVLFLLLRGIGGTVGRRRVGIIAVIVVTLGVSVFALKGLWTSRLGAVGTSSFDRPGSWLSGLRIGYDHPLAGVGPLNVAHVVANTPRYSITPWGNSSVNPHNVWLFALAAEGIPYALVLLWVSVVFVLGIARTSRRPADNYLVASILAVGIAFMINNLFTHLEIMVYMLLGAAILWANNAKDSPGPIGRSRGEPVQVPPPRAREPATAGVV